MPSTIPLLRSRGFYYLLFLPVTLFSSGCIAAAVTAGVVGAGAAGYAYYQGAVPRDIPANMDQSWAGAQLALSDLGMTVVSAQRDNDNATIESLTGDGEKVKITLEPRTSRVPADGQWTHVTVRVALLGDAPVTERIMKQIELRVAPPAGPAQQVPVIQGAPAQQVPVTQGAPTQPVIQTVAPPMAKQ